jgi:hypothetical protein
MSDASIEGVRATIDRAVAGIGDMQGALSLARDRGQAAVDIVKIGSRGSVHGGPTNALAHMTNADRLCEEAISATLAAVEELHAWGAIL